MMNYAELGIGVVAFLWTAWIF